MRREGYTFCSVSARLGGRVRAGRGRMMMAGKRGIIQIAWLPLLVQAGFAADPLAVTAVRFWSLSDVTRIAVETNGHFDFSSRRIDTNRKRSTPR